MAQLTISRANLKRIAKQAMLGEKLSREARAKLNEVAKTADEVVLHSWRLGECGCLVGTAYPELFTREGQWRKDSPDIPGLNLVGIRFDSLLQELVGKKYDDDRCRVKVIDA